jgi:2-oxoglutarate dehydrogenase complex, dehydrogenase (E1) component, and related enzymes
MQVCNLTTPSQYFHVLRRQVKRDFRKPLILMTPKSLLRSERAVSRLVDFTDSSFQPILPPTALGQETEVERLIFSTGKVYYDLLTYLEANQVKNTALIRIEQLYPLRLETLSNVIEPFSAASKWVWCQEEPKNMGAWSYISALFCSLNQLRIQYAGRAAAASPAVGSKAWHDHQQKELVQQAFTL